MFFFLQNVSFVDLVTNSSSVVYSTADAAAFKRLVDAIFRDAGLDLECDDVFDVYTFPDSAIDRMVDAMSGDERALYYEMPREQRRAYDRNAIIAAVSANQDQRPVWFEKRTDYGSIEGTSLLVTGKDGSLTEIGDIVARVFETEAYYDS